MQNLAYVTKHAYAYLTSLQVIHSCTFMCFVVAVGVILQFLRDWLAIIG